MLQIIRADRRHFRNMGWLQTVLRNGKLRKDTLSLRNRGKRQVFGEELQARDQFRAFGPVNLEIIGDGELELLLIDVSAKKTRIKRKQVEALEREDIEDASAMAAVHSQPVKPGFEADVVPGQPLGLP